MDYLSIKIEDNGIFHVELTEIVPTCKNNKRGVEGLPKWLETFLVSIKLLEVGRFKIWTRTRGSLVHNPFLIQMDTKEKNPLAPFKFHHFWLTFEDLDSW